MASGEVYRKLLLGKLDCNEGMVFEYMVAQMLTASGHKRYFYANPGKREASERMEIDFLIAKNAITNRHHVFPPRGQDRFPPYALFGPCIKSSSISRMSFMQVTGTVRTVSSSFPRIWPDSFEVLK